MSLDKSTPVFLLHGLGGAWWSMWPMKKFLEFAGWTRVHLLSEELDSVATESDMDVLVAAVSASMEQFASKSDDRVILIGQSMGGVVFNRMHKDGWDVARAVYIGSPLHGASILALLESILAGPITNALKRRTYDYLKNKPVELPPPHDYVTVSMSWPLTDFDGCVFRDEATLDKDRHVHLSCADHRSVFFNPRLWRVVRDALESP